MRFLSKFLEESLILESIAERMDAAVVQALQNDIAELLREAGIRLKSVPRLRQRIIMELSSWTYRPEELPVIRERVLDWVHKNKELWERMSS